ncbi:SGNH/GDSL hydrolase family protein [Streptomyces sp. NPDC050095]|uniref:SGNH/GDSL hydrolase family protein n=1 Tax=unclassified Streptomyces TaxID=2593676 RepID=UPI003436B4B3
MRLRAWGTAVLTTVCAGLLPVAPTAGAAPQPSGPVPLQQLFNNRGVSDNATPTEADFDGLGGSLSAQDLAAAGWHPGRRLDIDGARLTWPRPAGSGPDNVVAHGQKVRVSGQGDALSFLVAGTRGEAKGTGVVRYEDGSRSAYRLTAPDWRTGPLGKKSVALPHRNTQNGQIPKRTRLSTVTVPVRPGQRIASVDLPKATGRAALHVFAVSVHAGTPGWTGTWAASTGGRMAVGPWDDRTVRLVAHASAGGDRVRIRLANTFAAEPVRIGSASVALQATGAAARGKPVPLTFGGRKEAQLPAGAEEFSDPVDFRVPAGADLLVSLHLPGTVTSAPVRTQAIQDSYVSEPGDHATESSGSAYTSKIDYWPLLTGIDVSGGPGSVVVLGDSVTAGVKSTQDGNKRWPDALAARLREQSDAPRYGVLNAAISANRILSDRYSGDGVSKDTAGVRALHRLDRDVFAQTSAHTLVMAIGLNDLRWSASSDDVEHGMREIVDRAHARGMKVIGATLTPCAGECKPAVDARRVTVNSYVRGPRSGLDGVADLDAVVRDPLMPTRLRPAYDSGDHLHPNDVGLKAMAGAVNLADLADLEP